MSQVLPPQSESCNPSDYAYRRETCRLCDSRDLQVVLPLTPTPLADAYVSAEHVEREQPVFPLDLYMCNDCGFSQLLDVVQPQAIYFDYIYETKSSLGLVEHFGRYADEVTGRIQPAEGDLVVDIGSNDGSLLRFFKNKGLRVLGVDPAREIARSATEAGIPTLSELFTSELVEQIKQEHGPATIVSANNLFANVDDLAAMTDAIRELLADDGVFVFESFYLDDLLKNMVFDFIYHEHLSAFAVTPLDTFFRSRGMQLIDVQRVPTKGGSLRYTAQAIGGPREVSPSVAQMIQHEKDAGTCNAETFAKFTARINAAKNDTVELLKKLKAEGKTVAGYGASATTTTLLYHFGIAEYLDYLVDDYASKQNLCSPGDHLPVLPSEVIYDRKPDYILVIAWRYYEPIVAKHPNFLKEGGHFIVPLPELKVI